MAVTEACRAFMQWGHAREDEKGYPRALETVKIMALRICVTRMYRVPERRTDLNARQMHIIVTSIRLSFAVNCNSPYFQEPPVMLASERRGCYVPILHTWGHLVEPGAMRKGWPANLCKPLGPPGKRSRAVPQLFRV